jgi:tRNA (guanine6-N2)-methyltransferase
MSIFLSTFISGFGSLVQKTLIKDVSDAKILETLDGAILYESNLKIEELKQIRYFNNSFLVLQKFKYKKSNQAVLNKMLEATIKNPNIINKKILNSNNGKTFRIFTSLENNSVSVNFNLLSSVEKIIQQNLGLKKSIVHPHYEFWYLYRSENIGFFMLRVTNVKSKPERGELRPELANILCLLSNPKDEDTVLDPFAGSGSILLERARIGKFKGLFALDKDSEISKKLKEKIKKIKNKKLQKSFFVKNKDFFETSFDEGFFDSIIMDPPWGFFEKVDEGVENLYRKILEKSFLILKNKGRLILLTARKLEFGQCIQEFGKFKIIEKYDILVSGKKCGVYTLRK